MMRLGWQYLPFACAFIGVAALTTMSGLAPSLYHAVMEFWLVQYHNPAFLDAGGIASAIECERQGIDPYIQNPCDPLHRQLVYPPVWKLLAAFPLTYLGSTSGIAAGFILIFLVSLLLLPKPRSSRDALIMSAAVIAPPFGWAINAGNNDLLIFALASVGIWIWARTEQRGKGASWPAYAIFMIAGVLKYFPAAILLLAARERLSRAAVIALAASAIGCASYLLWTDQWPAAFANIWNISVFTYSYGTENIGTLASKIGIIGESAGVGLKWVISILVMSIAWIHSRRKEIVEAFGQIDGRESAFLLGGSLLILSSYLLTQNVAYRLIFLLMAMPGMIRIAQEASSSTLLRALPWLALLVMYVFPIRRHLGNFADPGSGLWVFANLMGVYLREVSWLILAVGLGSLIFAWLRQSPAYVDLVRWFQGALRSNT